MAARGYEFYLRLLKVSLTSERSAKPSEKKEARDLGKEGSGLFYNSANLATLTFEPLIG